MVPVGGLARMLALVQAFMGLVTVALVIGYLPTLFGAYSRRGVQLLTLDRARGGDRRRRATGLLHTWKGWADARNAAIMAVLFLFFGFMLVGDGIAVLS